MKNNHASVYDVLHDATKKTFSHFLTVLKGLFGFLLASVTFVGLFIGVNFPLFSSIIEQAPNLIEKFNACNGDAICQKGVLWPFLAPHSTVLIISLIIGALLFIWVSIGYIRFNLSVHDTGNASLKELFPSPLIVLKLIIASVLAGLMVLGGLILLIIPGIYLALRFSQFYYFILDKNAGIIESLKMSWAATRGHGWWLLALYIIAIIISTLSNILSILLIITMPLVSMVYACMYRSLTSEHNQHESAAIKAE